MDAFATAIDKFNEFMGKIGALLVLPLVGVVFYEILMRYVFNKPTIWGFELTLFIYGLNYMLGLALTEGRGGHVSVDVLTMRMGPRKKALMGIISYVVLFVPTWVCMSIWTVKYAVKSTSMLERNPTSWNPPVWPIKLLMALGVVMLFLQGISTLIRHIQTYRGLKD